MGSIHSISVISIANLAQQSFITILQSRLVWLQRPILELQSFPRSKQMWSVAGLSPWFRAFLVCLFASACSASVASKPCLPPSWVFCGQGFLSVDENARGLQAPLADISIA